MQTFIDIVELLTKLLPLLFGFGVAWKWLPGLQKTVNEGVIPVVNTILAFLLAFAGPAHAGILGDVGKAFSLPAQLFLSASSAMLVAVIHDKLMKPFTPQSPYRRAQALKMTGVTSPNAR